MARHPRANVGDVIAIPIKENSISCGQVIDKKSIIYVVIFQNLYKNFPNLDEDVLNSPILVGWTADAEIHHSQWKIIGNLPLCQNANFRRNCKVLYGGDVWVESFDGELLHKASTNEVGNLYNRSSYSPARFERAIRAFHGFEQWSPEFDDLLVAPRLP